MRRRQLKPRPGDTDTPLFDSATGAPTVELATPKPALELRGMPEQPHAAEERIYTAAFTFSKGFEEPPTARTDRTVTQHDDLGKLLDTAEQVSRNLKRFELTGYDPTASKSIYSQYIDSEVRQAAAFARESAMGLSASDRRKAIATRAAETRRSRENALTLHAAAEHYPDILDAWEAAYAALPEPAPTSV